MAGKTLRNRLNRLFNTNTVVRRIGKGRIKVIDTDRLQSSGNLTNSRYIDRFARLHGGSTSAGVYNSNYNYHSSKIQLFGDYESMDQDSIISSVLDIYADESTMKDEYGDILTIKSSDENVRKILYNLFYDILNVEFNLWPWVRNMCKYGDFYLYHDIEEEVGIVGVTPMSAYEMVREEAFNPENPYEVRFIQQGGLNERKFLKNYEVSHFRLLSDSNFLPYGKSQLEGARKVWKQLNLMEDAMMIHRIMRAPERRIFKIDVGNIPPNEVDQYMQRIVEQMKKVPFIDESTGDYNLKYNMQNITEDFYLPVRGGNSSTEIDTLSGLTYEAIDDIEYLRNRMLAALRVPKAFIGYDEGIEGKATLAQEDIRFARTIERFQKIVVSELTKIAVIHLAAQGYENAQLVNFELCMTSPSIVYEQEKIELWNQKVDLASNMKDLKLLSDEWIYTNVFNFSEDQYKSEQVKVIDNLKQTFRKAQIEDEGNDPAKTGKSFGTPHDVASLHSTRPGDSDFVEQEYNGGRPEESGNYGTDDSNMGRNPLGKPEKPGLNRNSSSSQIKHNYKGSPLSMESLAQSVRGNVKSKGKDIILESINTPKVDVDKGTMLDESKLLDDNEK
jgi:hypothetical protein